jgi:outer membrane protein assembly factor BamD
MKRTTLERLTLLLALAALGCGSGKVREDPILRLSAQEALEEGKALLADEKYARAEQLLTHAFEVEPNSRSGREALLLAADALYLDGGTESYIKCEAKYRDFLNRFPTSERADYAQYQVANCLAARVEKPDRDQKVTSQALQSFEELMRLYPTSPYAAEARSQIEDVTDRLAMHEVMIGHFYLRFRNCQATIQRLEYLQREYPNISEMDRALFTLGLGYDACNRTEDADATFDKLAERFPDSPYLYRVERERKQIGKVRDKLIRRAEKRRGGAFRPAPPVDEPEKPIGEGGGSGLGDEGGP